MSEAPWLTIIGLGEDGLKGLTAASQSALDSAEIVMGPARHLGLLGDLPCETVEWPVPFAEGVQQLLSLRGRRVVVLASGDPFWFGAGAVLARHLGPHEWKSLPTSSVFSLVANRLGWPLETTLCLGLHAAPLTRVRPHLATGMRLIVLLRDGAAVRDLADYLGEAGFGETSMTVFEALGGPRERVTNMHAKALSDTTFQHPVCVACDILGAGAAMPLAIGRPDTWFDNDGQITKQPIRAMTLSALAPHPFEHLWDIGGGSGSIGIEWLLCHPTLQATAIEPRPDRAARITANAASLGVDRLRVVTGAAPEALAWLDTPQAVFIGGGLSENLLHWLVENLAAGTRLVANAVTLETEALLLQAQEHHGGELMRLELSRSKPLGPRRGWKASYPIVQWSVTL
ncbi:precorrin-6y C5,15-methyltransferase (decarboxylating) subunit CbiE [uncultured Roseobacter sp.]|uniref:precorrin-6y C5,15-methyltransferase (decarboxylating) subunit CbiE n=1 Tax=uncultured Roseobacter sp. TaxID=114847 RepID=UPI002635A41D|nr:precorrin-6y C5,15-methyltransferase (decarboxylating) subunit CbiE [uncultured Roseobacter sp.]